MLTAQVHTLGAIFNNLAQQAALNMGACINATETYLRLALKAQSQCRATLETLAALKNPPIIGYVNQANIAHGPQQMNNGAAPANETPRTPENNNPPNKLLESQHDKRMDLGTTRAASGTDPAMAPVGKIDRPRKRRGQGKGGAQRR